MLTIGHGRRSLDELVGLLREAEIETLIDVRRVPFSRRNPQFQPAGRDGDRRRRPRLPPPRGGRRPPLRRAGRGAVPMPPRRRFPQLRGGRMISELLAARGHEFVHVLRPGERERLSGLIR
ncbi:MAG: DUF488 domain-containing protein [Actinomycetota bacterium]|nr:DUF488 domain-containing protein [Actinomycetota bacterium]